MEKQLHDAAPTDPIDYRGRAWDHFEAARELLASQDDRKLLYACLELRLTIEALAYDTMQLYRKDLTADVLRTWQADRLIRELVALDPGVDGAVSVVIDGKDGGPPLELVEHRMTAAWVQKAYPQLGSFLHEKSLLQLERGKELDRAMVRDRAEKIGSEIGRFFDSTGFHFRLLINYTLKCDCGAGMILSISPTQTSGIVTCETCAARYEMRPKSPGTPDTTFIGQRVD